MIRTCISMVETGQNIRRLMNERNLSANDIVEACGFTKRQAVYAWFSGKNLPTVDNLVILSELFNVTIDDIIIRR